MNFQFRVDCENLASLGAPCRKRVKHNHHTKKGSFCVYTKFSSTDQYIMSEQHRLFCRGKHISYQRAKRTTNPDVSLIKIEGCDTPAEAQFYLGKRVAYVYKAKKEIRGSRIRVIWGKIARSHGNSGLVRARFRNNLPYVLSCLSTATVANFHPSPKTFGASVRVMLYPSTI